MGRMNLSFPPTGSRTKRWSSRKLGSSSSAPWEMNSGENWSAGKPPEAQGRGAFPTWPLGPRRSLLEKAWKTSRWCARGRCLRGLLCAAAWARPRRRPTSCSRPQSRPRAAAARPPFSRPPRSSAGPGSRASTALSMCSSAPTGGRCGTWPWSPRPGPAASWSRSPRSHPRLRPKRAKRRPFVKSLGHSASFDRAPTRTNVNFKRRLRTELNNNSNVAFWVLGKYRGILKWPFLF
mmetsp:Transcript_40577/g.91184  ORF Transcript_40577/g.91184 Transcript_40577/m.91184 type:complete len:235 (-) Transcript_40577:18-722(-)